MSVNVKVDTHYTFTIALEGVTQQLCLDVAQARKLKYILNAMPALMEFDTQKKQSPMSQILPCVDVDTKIPQPHLSKMLTQEQIKSLKESYERLRKEKEALEQAQKPWTGVLHPSFWRKRHWPPGDLVGGAQSGPDSWAAKSAPGGGYEFP